MEKIRMSFISLQRVLKIASRAGEISEFEQNTLRYLVDQCSEEEQEHIIQRFGKQLPFLVKKQTVLNRKENE